MQVALILSRYSFILTVQLPMIARNIEHIRERIAKRCESVGRNPSDIILLAVSKTFSAEHIADAVRSGVFDIGENYVQELLLKKSALHDDRIRWHFIGHLQSNKVRHLAEWISLIQTVDTIGLAREIELRGSRSGRVMDVLVEVNTTGEGSKFGVRPNDAVGFVKQLADLGHVRILGLMTIGPFLPDPEGSRSMFRQLRMLKEEIEALGQPNVSMKHLSMGMTGDFEVAIDEGATILRLGTAIFGSRTAPH